MKLNYFYYLVIAILTVVIIFKYGISSGLINQTYIKDTSCTLEYDGSCFEEKTKQEIIIKNNCIIKNMPIFDKDNDRENRTLKWSVEKFCDEISTNPSIFHYINYYFF